MKVPYIGITGVMSSYETTSIMKAFPLHAPRKVMIGVLSSSKKLRGQANKYPGRYPECSRIKGIFIPHPLAFNVIHYSTDKPNTLCDQLMEVTDLGGDHLHGFQLNVAWPSIDGLKAYRAAHPNKQIILQIGTHAFDMISHTPSILAACVEQYTKYIDYVLLDPSGGHGKALNPHIMRDYLQALSDKHLEIGHGVAGGLGSPDALETLRPLVSDFPYLSIDAESRLRDANDNLQLIPAIQYALTSLRLFMKAQISDVDLDIMSMGRLKKEILELRSVIREHRDQIGDDRCWINDLRIYKAVPDNAPIITNLPPKEIFVGHCSHFWDTRQCPENEQNLHQW